MFVKLISDKQRNELPTWPNSKLISIIKWSVVFAAIAYLLIGLYLYIAGPAEDLYSRWRESGYCLHGYNPISVMHNEGPALKEYGSMKTGEGYPPWSYIYALIIASPLLPYQTVKWLFLFINILAITALSFFIRYECSQHDMQKQWPFLFAAAMCSLAVPNALRYGQYGIIVTVSLWAFLYFEAKGMSFWSGFFLAFALIKPQTAGLFFLLPLVRKSFKSCFWCMMIILVTTAVAAWRCHTWPWILLTDMLNVGAIENDFYMGIGDQLKFYIDKKLLLGLSVSIFACTSFILLVLLRKAPILYLAAILAVFSTMWMSHREHDLMVISLLVVPLLLLSMREKSSSLMIISLLVGLSYWAPHLSRFYYNQQLWIIPFLVRIFWFLSVGFVIFYINMHKDKNNGWLKTNT